MEINDNYLTVTDLSRIHGLGERQIRKMIDKIKPTTTPQLIWKDANNRYMVHPILTSRFKRVRKPVQKYYALTVSPSYEYTEKDLHQIMDYVIRKMEGAVEVNYTVETNKTDNRNHLHCYINCNQRRNLMRLIKEGLDKINFCSKHIHDLEKWRQYMTKSGGKITTLKKN